MTTDPLNRFRRAWRIPSILGRSRPDEPFPNLPEALRRHRRPEPDVPTEPMPGPEDGPSPGMLRLPWPPPGRPRPKIEMQTLPWPPPGQPDSRPRPRLTLLTAPDGMTADEIAAHNDEAARRAFGALEAVRSETEGGDAFETAMTREKPGQPIGGPELPPMIPGGGIFGPRPMPSRPPQRPGKGRPPAPDSGGSPVAPSEPPTPPEPPELPPTFPGREFREGFAEWWRREGWKFGKRRKEDRNFKMGPSESYIWQNLSPNPPIEDKPTRTNGRSGKHRRYFQWDPLHGEIEIYDHRGRHLRAIDPATGRQIKGPEKGRSIPTRRSSIDVSSEGPA